MARMTEVTHSSLGWRSAFAATLAMSMGVGPFAIIAVSALSPLVVPEFELSRTELGSLATLAFGVAAVSSVVGGRQVDIRGGRTVLLWVLGTGGVAVAVMAGAQSLMWLWIGAILCGASQGVAHPITNKLITEHIPIGRQGLQIGVTKSGVQMAQAVIGFALPPMALIAGWRGSMLIGVFFAVLGIILMLAVIPSSPARAPQRVRAKKPRTDSVVLWLTLYTFMIAATLAALTVHVPLYSFDRLGLTAALAGMTTGVTGVAGVAARILWVRMAERWDTPIHVLAIIAAVAFISVMLVLVSEYAGAFVLWPGLVGFGSSAMAANAVVMLAIIRRAGTGGTGRETGLVALGLFLGFMTGPVTFGAVVDSTNSYTIALSAAGLMSLLALTMTICWHWRNGNSRTHVA